MSEAWRCQWLSLMLLADATGLAIAGESTSPVQLTDSPLSADRLMDTASGLIIVVLVIVAAAWLLRRFGHLPGVGKGTVKIVGGVSLGARERAVLIETQGDRLLIGVAPGQVRTLRVWPGVASCEKNAFAETLEQASTRRTDMSSKSGDPA